MNKTTLMLFIIFSASISFAQTIRPDFANVEYATVNGIILTLDIYLPPHISYPYPTVVWIHGGGWQSGSKENVNGLWLIQKGFAIVSINYRLTDKAIHPAQINDCKAAIRWIRANSQKYHFDNNKIGVFGSSAGGHLAALVGSSGDVRDLEGEIGGNLNYSSRVQAVCDWYGPANFLTICGTVPPTSNHCDDQSPEGKLIGGDLRTNPDKCRSVSPITYVSIDDPPFLIMHGTADNTVPFRQSVELDSAYRAIGNDVTFIPQPGAGHGGGSFNSDSTKQRISDFFKRALMGITAVEEKYIPASFQLGQNYPNPFNPSTVISYQISAFSHVSLKVYDVLGREVATLADEFKQAGNYSTLFTLNSSLSSGVYFYQLKAGNPSARSGQGFMETKKMLLIK